MSMKGLKAIQDRPVIRTILTMNKRFNRDGGSYLAVVIGYYGFLSLFPMLLLGLAVAGFIFAKDPEAKSEWLRRMAHAIPGADILFADQLDKLQKNRTGTSIIGIAGLVWAGMKVIEATQWALGNVFRVGPVDSAVKRKVQALEVLVGLGALAFASIALAGTITALRAEGALDVVLQGVGFGVTFALDFLLFLAAYRLLIPRRGPRFSELWQGALFTAFFWTVLKIVGGVLFKTFAPSNPIYGTFATVLGALAVLFLVSRIFVYGAELNAVLIEDRKAAEGEASAEPAESGLAPRPISDLPTDTRKPAATGS